MEQGFLFALPASGLLERVFISLTRVRGSTTHRSAGAAQERRRAFALASAVPRFGDD